MTIITSNPFARRPASMIAAIVLVSLGSVSAQPVPAPAPAGTRVVASAADLANIAGLAWLEGCWAGNVNQREFREHWGPLRGGMLVGAGSTVYQGKTQSYEYLRVESRPDGVFYVALPSGQRETAFKLAAIEKDDKDSIFVFTNPENEFPQRISYRRGTEGWLYATIDGKIKGEDKQVIFPMRHVDCESGEFILK